MWERSASEHRLPSQKTMTAVLFDFLNDILVQGLVRRKRTGGREYLVRSWSTWVNHGCLGDEDEEKMLIPGRRRILSYNFEIIDSNEN